MKRPGEKWNQDEEWLRLFRAARELMRAVKSGEASVSGPGGWVFTEMGRALERIQLTAEEERRVL